MFKGTMTKWPVQKLAQGTTQKLLQHHDATDISTNYIFVFLRLTTMFTMFTRKVVGVELLYYLNLITTVAAG